MGKRTRTPTSPRSCRSPAAPENAVEAFEEALSRYEAKENIVMAGLMRERLATLQAEAG
jgi:hypothetical protein